MKTIEGTKVKDHGGGFSRYAAKCPYCEKQIIFDQQDMYEEQLVKNTYRCRNCHRFVRICS